MMNSYFFALFCLTVAVTHVHSLDCCDDDFIEEYNLKNRNSLLTKKQSLVNYKVCLLSAADAKRFNSVSGKSECGNVTVEVVRNDMSKVSRTYTFERGDEHIYHQVGTDPKVDITMYGLFDENDCVCEYGCINKNDENNCNTDCAEKTTFVQCVIPASSDLNAFKKCKDSLQKVYPNLETESLG